MKSITVFCGSSEGNDKKVLEQAYALGKFLASQKIKLVYGAAHIGVMGQVATGALDHGGTVIGVIPDFLKVKEVCHTGLTDLIVTKTMHERKLIMHELSDGVITLPGGFGTLEELFEMITWAQLGLHRKPVGILNTSGFYDELISMLKKMVASELLKPQNFEMLLVSGEINTLWDKMLSYKPLQVPKWINKQQT